MANLPSSFPLTTAVSPPRPSPYPFLSHENPELDLSFLADSSPRRSKCRPQCRGQTRKQETTHESFNDPVINMETLGHNARLNNSTQLPTRNQLRTTAPLLSQQAESSTCNEHLLSLEGVELNTALCLKAKIQALQATEFQSQKAVEKTVKNSGRTRKQIDSRATEGVNVTRSKLLFNSLVSIKVQEDQLISQALQDRLQLTMPSPQQREREEVTPFVHFLKTSDLFRQQPLPQEKELVCKYRCTTFPALSTFDLHIRQRRWKS